MANRLTRIYTRTGDTGTTGLGNWSFVTNNWTSSRLPKISGMR